MFPPAEFMRNFSSTTFQTSPSGSLRGNSLATLFCPKMRPTSANSTSMSPTTGKFASLSLLLKRRVVFGEVSVICLLPRSLNVDMEWLYGASENSNMEVDIGYLPQVRLQAPVSLLKRMNVLMLKVYHVHSWSCSQWAHPRPTLSWTRTATSSTVRTLARRSSLSSRTSTGHRRSVIRKRLDAWTSLSTLSRR